jgi:hypothetical protein
MASIIDLHYLPASGVKDLLDGGLAVGHKFEFQGRTVLVKFIGRTPRTMPEGQMIPIGVVIA